MPPGYRQEDSFSERFGADLITSGSGDLGSRRFVDRDSLNFETVSGQASGAVDLGEPEAHAEVSLEEPVGGSVSEAAARDFGAETPDETSLVVPV